MRKMTETEGPTCVEVGGNVEMFVRGSAVNPSEIGVRELNEL